MLPTLRLARLALIVRARERQGHVHFRIFISSRLRYVSRFISLSVAVWKGGHEVFSLVLPRVILTEVSLTKVSLSGLKGTR